MIEFKSYKDNTNLFFPNDSVDPKEKVGKDFCTQFAKAIYHLYLNDSCSMNFSNIAKIRNLRLYGEGNQPKDIYYPMVLGKAETTTTGSGRASEFGPGAVTTAARKGYANINFEIYKVAPKYITTTVGLFEDTEFDIFADGIDQNSAAMRQEEQCKVEIEMLEKEFFAKFEAMYGVKTEKPDYIPESIEELKMFAEMDGFKLKSEIAIEAALQYTLFLSRWKEVKRKQLVDLAVIGMAGAKDYVNPQTQKVEARYCDPEMCVIPYSKVDDYRNMPFAGEFVFWTIAELRQLNVFTDEELHTIATAYLGLLGNSSTPFGAFNSSVTGIQAWHKFKVCVLDCEYLSDDCKYTTVYKKEDGTQIVKESEYGKVRNSDKKKTIETKTLMVYKCKWIVGTDLCWDYGHQFDIPRPTPSKAKSSFHFAKVAGPSMMEMMVIPLDQFQLGYLRAQGAISQAPNAGLAIDIATISNVMIGKDVKSPLEIMKIRRQTGDLLYSSTTHRGYAPQATGYKPIQELSGGAGEQLNEAIKYMEIQLMAIQDIVGITRQASAGNTTSSDLVGVNEMAMQSTITVLKPLFAQYVSIKERLCENIALRVQLLVKVNGEYELGYYEALGAPQTKILKIGSEVNNAMMNIRIQARPSAEEKRVLMEAASTSLNAGKNGLVGITTSDFLRLNRFVQEGKLKWAEIYLSFQEKKAAEKQQADAQANIQQQTEGNQALQKQKDDAAAALAQMAKQNLIETTNLTTDATIKIENAKHNNRMEELRLELGIKEDMNFENNQTKLAATHMTNHAASVHKGADLVMHEDKMDLEQDKMETAKEIADKAAKNKVAA